MAPLTLSQVVLPTFTRGLTTLSHILTVAATHAKSADLDADAEYAPAQLIADMKPLTFQVQTATTTVRKALARLLGAQDAAPAWADDEKTLADLQARIASTQALLAAADAATIDARAAEIVEVPFWGSVYKLAGQDAALKQAIPNFFFHVQTAFAILRAKGVPIGKRDYLSNFFEVPI
ncbi:hypothetical protein B0T24DRAFT_669033 [Lasiosphaeria ovina]|uniref:DUF1993 domain-containing protein n=1 Tax=Lasiosphaeria ovina TaxID=92902 RepID=A0AAE0N3Q9_9PEZI|nr:hypothetical protein B0T24DRAFT_669033 [Lasiosphaeria ovina]